MRIVVTGGCGYIGSALVRVLLANGHDVDVIDLQWFGRNLPTGSRLRVLKCDFRDAALWQFLINTDCVIHLAAVANDPCGELDPKLTWEINALGTEQLIDAAVRAGVPRFIYASSGSVYGLKNETHVTEDLQCVPLSEYNKTKMVAERVVTSYADKMIVQILRPATVCGWSPRTRLDVAVNALTIGALSKGAITVYGGDQMRPNLHIVDMVRAYEFLLACPDVRGIYNVGQENMSINEIAELVQSECGGDVVVRPSTDPRSYRLDSSKFKRAGFHYTESVASAVRDLVQAYRDGRLVDSDNGYNLRVMPR